MASKSLRRRRPALVALISLLAVLWAGVAAASPGPALSFPRLDIQVMPEYDLDFPQTLVIVQGLLRNAGSEPWTGEILFHMPVGADVRSFCELSGDPFTTSNPVHTNEFALGKAKVVNRGDHSEISWNPARTLKPGESIPLHMEWYYPAVTGGPDKKLPFQLTASYPAQKITLEVAQPSRSSNYAASAKEVGAGPGEAGITYHHYEFGAVEAGQAIQLDISYTRADNSRSITTAAGAKAARVQGIAGNTTMLWLTGGLVVALGYLVFGGGFRGSRASAGVSRGAGRGAAAGAAGGGIAQRLMAATRAFGAPGGATTERARSSVPPTSPAAPPVRPGSRHDRQRRQGPARGPATTARPQPGAEDERRAARRLLLAGQISEETYRQILADLDREGA